MKKKKRNIWDSLLAYLCIAWIIGIYLDNLIYGNEPSISNVFAVTLMWIYIMAKEVEYKVVSKIENKK